MDGRRKLMLPGFIAALIGDVLLAVLGSPRQSVGFLGGVVSFCTAHLLWTVAQLREVSPHWKAFVVLAIPLSVFAGLRLTPFLPVATAIMVLVYAFVSAFSLATALATRRIFYIWGIGLLVVSDLFIGGRWMGVPGCGSLVGPTYLLAESCLLVSFFWSSERRVDWLGSNPYGLVVKGGCVSALCFLAGMSVWPGGGYNPCLRMLSALGRTRVKGVEWPLCHMFFVLGMFAAAATIARVWPHLLQREDVAWRRRMSAWGIALNVGGLLTISLVPEDVNELFHNAGCWLAALGGAFALFARDKGGMDRVWAMVVGGMALMFGVVGALHAMKMIPFVPWMPTGQKILILAFSCWLLGITRSLADCRAIRLGRCLGGLVLGAIGVVTWRGWATPLPVAMAVEPTKQERGKMEPCPLSVDEQAALKWLDHVTGPLPPVEEKDLWNIGGSQHGLFAKRYNIAFAGYAAATLGLRGSAEERAVVGRILKNCIGRYLEREVWAYSQSKSYWGRKPWAPDPCYRENVMYTGHLLQLLALYELFTGDTTYWSRGFDFVWDRTHQVHYTVQKLIDVTVEQMRKGATGGVSCEPGLVFFPCNNHPQIALKIFARLGHGDWSPDARRWESWALAHYRHPICGGGVLNLVYHERSGLFYPFGHPGLDGWSLLWYEAWATERGSAIALWREAAAKIDWKVFDAPSDKIRGGMECADPSDVPATASASFLAAAARACGDPETAERLERALDVHLVREKGYYFLDLDREWRIGATANRILALAEANGSSWRKELEK